MYPRTVLDEETRYIILEVLTLVEHTLDTVFLKRDLVM